MAGYEPGPNWQYRNFRRYPLLAPGREFEFLRGAPIKKPALIPGFLIGIVEIRQPDLPLELESYADHQTIVVFFRDRPVRSRLWFLRAVPDKRYVEV